MKKYFKGCTGKVFYVSEREARTYARRIKSKSTISRKVEVYKCKYKVYGLVHWHTTSMSKDVYKRRQKFIPRSHL